MASSKSFVGLTLVLSALLCQVNAALTIPQNVSIAGLTSNWTYSGCYSDDVAARTLNAAAYTNTTGLTIESCISFCYNKGYNFAGAEYAQECCTNPPASFISSLFMN